MFKGVGGGGSVTHDILSNLYQHKNNEDFFLNGQKIFIFQDFMAILVFSAFCIRVSWGPNFGLDHQTFNYYKMVNNGWNFGP
jgi:hypothetical protein